MVQLPRGVSTFLKKKIKRSRKPQIAMRDTADKAEMIKWWDAMDRLLVSNGAEQDIAEGLRMARACQHEDSKWLCALFPEDKPVPSKDEMKQVFLSLDDRRALFFAGTIAVHDDDLVQRSAELGYAPAQVLFASGCEEVEQFEWAAKAAAQGDRDGLCQLALCWRDGCGVSEDDAKALQLFKEAAELGHAEAQWCYGHGFDENSWERYLWWRRAAAGGHGLARRYIVEEAVPQLKLFNEGKGSGRVLFEIGAACKGHLGGGKAFGLLVHDDWLHATERAVALRNEWCEDAKRAVCCWMLCAKQLGVAKDLRLLIAGVLWAERVAWIPTGTK